MHKMSVRLTENILHVCYEDNWSKLFREIIAVYFAHHARHLNTVYVKIQSF
jgi:hypothetical protein